MNSSEEEELAQLTFDDENRAGAKEKKENIREIYKQRDTRFL